MIPNIPVPGNANDPNNNNKFKSVKILLEESGFAAYPIVMPNNAIGIPPAKAINEK